MPPLYKIRHFLPSRSKRHFRSIINVWETRNNVDEKTTLWSYFRRYPLYIYLLTYIDTRSFWNECFCPPPSLKQVLGIKRLRTRPSTSYLLSRSFFVRIINSINYCLLYISFFVTSKIRKKSVYILKGVNEVQSKSIPKILIITSSEGRLF